jgi:vacuolar-type H+-ATPase subunit D/Vma8
MSQGIAPTRMALQVMKTKLVGAKKGYELLKKKSDALKVGGRRIACPCGAARLAARGSPTQPL